MILFPGAARGIIDVLEQWKKIPQSTSRVFPAFFNLLLAFASVGLEAVIAAPFAIGVIVVLAVTGGGAAANHGTGQLLLMMLTGPITAIPLLCFAAAAQRLPLVTLGLLQHLTPSMQMILGVAMAREPMPPARWIGFGLIWVALAVFSADAVSRAFRGRTGKLAPS
jgi:chloramphenicol-sensitive protein RarD